LFFAEHFCRIVDFVSIFWRGDAGDCVKNYIFVAEHFYITIETNTGVMTPREVLKTLAADWLQNDLSYHDIARITGYKYATIANYMSHKKTYLTPQQAERFRPLGYNMDFLMFGKGTLRLEEDPGKISANGNDFLPDSYKVTFLMYVLKSIADYTDDPLTQVIQKKVYRAFTTTDKHECAEVLAEIQHVIAMGLVNNGIAQSF